MTTPSPRPETSAAAPSCNARPWLPSPSGLLVVGLGNVLLQDDGVGVHAVRALAASPERGIAPVEVGTEVLDRLDLFEHAPRIVAIDALPTGERPGTVHVLKVRDLDPETGRPTLDELSVASALRGIRRGGMAEIVLVGVVPRALGPQVGLSAPVREALPRVLSIVRRIARGQWPDLPIPTPAYLPDWPVASGALSVR
ncbi:MAG: hydrogenase maturation protease [Acidobacteria bacterium]|nr:hydrogenase maturation protease [Acidobacteriota bacterium]